MTDLEMMTTMLRKAEMSYSIQVNLEFETQSLYFLGKPNCSGDTTVAYSVQVTFDMAGNIADASNVVWVNNDGTGLVRT